MNRDSGAADRWSPDRYRQFAAFVPEYGAELVKELDPRPGERVLDIGCGDGALTSRIVASGASVLGVDASPAMIEAACRRGIHAIPGRAESLTFEREFDAVFSNAALHWVPEAAAVLAGVARALRPGGRMVVEQGGSGNVKSVRQALIAELYESRGIQTDLSEFWYFPTPEQHAAKLERAGFAVNRIRVFSRPTPIPTGMDSWLATLAAPILDLVPGKERAAFRRRVVDRLRPMLRTNSEGESVLDYVRLRYHATLEREAR